MTDPTHTHVSRLDLADAALRRLWLLGSVLPRAMTTTLTSARRWEAVEAPPLQPGVREFCEIAADEFFIAVNALTRRVPTVSDLEVAVAECAAAATELTELGIAGTHRAPRPLKDVATKRARIGGIAFEHLQFASRPRLPLPLVRAGFDVPEVAHVRVLRHSGAPRPWVVCIHGAGQGRRDDLFTFRVKHLHRDLGLNVALPVLPEHGPRRSPGSAYPGFVLLNNIAITVRAVSDVRSLLGWIEAQGAPEVSVLGMSLGAPVAALVSGVDPRVGAVAVTVPMLGMHATVSHHLRRAGTTGRRMADLFEAPGVRAVDAVIDPMSVVPLAPAHRRLLVAAVNDRMTSVRAARRLHDSWGGQVHWHPGGHIGHLLSPDVRSVVDEFLTHQSAGGAAKTAEVHAL
jgi:pimeloyl-ACP methyl ester carboxylesterase